jgi:hypothetical protein
MSDAHLSEPTFTALATRDGTYCIRMDQHTDAPVLHIGSFDSERDAQAWIRDESAAWLAKRQPRETAPNRRRARVANVG